MTDSETSSQHQGGGSARRVVYITGGMHSGSTALDLLIGHIVGRSCGQVVDLGDYLLPDGTIDLDLVSRIQISEWLQFLESRSMQRKMDMRWLLAENLHEAKFFKYFFSRRARIAYAKRSDDVMREIFQFTGKNILIDSSKYASRALGLLESKEFEVHIIHVIRGPLPYLCSIQKRNGQLSIWQQLSQVARWLSRNALSHAVRWQCESGRFHTLLYRKLSAEPAEALAPLIAKLGLNFSPTALQEICGEEFAPPELIGGNRMRRAETIRFETKFISAEEAAGIHPAVRFLCKVIETSMRL